MKMDCIGKHEHMACPRCQRSFECRVGSINLCQCQAVQLTDEELRSVVFGDPAMHSMALYKQRIDALMFAAVSGEVPG